MFGDIQKYMELAARLIAAIEALVTVSKELRASNEAVTDSNKQVLAALQKKGDENAA